MPEDANNFYESDRVSAQPVEFKDLFQMTVAGNLFLPDPLDHSTCHPAIVVGHPMGAVKEQSANLYAIQLAERGFVTLAIDLPCWGDSEGPRNHVSPDLYAEGFSAGVDFLVSQAFVDADAIGGIGICGSGGFILSAAKIDSRLKAVATVSMYDMGQATRHGIGNSISRNDREAMIEAASAQRNIEFAGGETEYTGGAPHEIDANSHPIAREFYDFYRTPRGQFTPAGQSPALTTHPTLTSNVKFLNFYPFNDLETIAPRPLLFVAGDQAHSREFSEDAYARAAEPKELYWVPGADHVDLYDRIGLIPFDKLKRFFSDALA